MTGSSSPPPPRVTLSPRFPSATRHHLSPPSFFLEELLTKDTNLFQRPTAIEQDQQQQQPREQPQQQQQSGVQEAPGLSEFSTSPTSDRRMSAEWDGSSPFPLGQQ